MSRRVDWKVVGIFAGLVAAWLTSWEVAVRMEWVSDLAPYPADVLDRGRVLLSDAFVRQSGNVQGVGWHILSSLRRVTLGFLLGALVAVPIGFLMGMSPTWSRAVDPFVQILRPVSPLVWLPLGMAMIQDSERNAVFVIFMAAAFPLLINTALGIRQVPQAYLDLARTLEAGRGKVIVRVILPAALPSIVTGVRLSFGTAWLVIVAAEMLSGNDGIGYFTWNEWNNLNVSSLVVVVFLVGGVGLALDRIVRRMEQVFAYD